MKLSQLSLADYNQLDNIPVINQDLSASGFTPTANTYYRHTGATTDTFTQGIIYLYDTAYHKLGESSGGGTTLNKYTYTVSQNEASSINYERVRKICLNSKGKVEITFNYFSNCSGTCSTMYNNADAVIINYLANQSSLSNFVVGGCYLLGSNVYSVKCMKLNEDGTFSYTTQNPFSAGVKIIYYNDTEITA